MRGPERKKKKARETERERLTVQFTGQTNTNTQDESRSLWEGRVWVQPLSSNTIVSSTNLSIYPLCSVSLLLSCPLSLLNTQCMHIHIYTWNTQALIVHKQFKAGSLNKQNNLLPAYKLQALPARSAMHLQYTANILYEQNPCNRA